MPLLTIAAYARHRGVSGQAVSYAITEGRIKVVIDPKTGKRFLDRDKADADWAANTNHDKRPRNGKTKHESRVEGAAQVEQIPDAGSNTKGVPQLAESRAIKEAYQARIAKIEYEQLSGSLISLEEVNTRWVRVATMTKTRVLGVASKCKARLSHLSLEDIAIIEEELRAALADLADAKGAG